MTRHELEMLLEAEFEKDSVLEVLFVLKQRVIGNVDSEMNYAFSGEAGEYALRRNEMFDRAIKDAFIKEVADNYPGLEES